MPPSRTRAWRSPNQAKQYRALKTAKQLCAQNQLQNAQIVLQTALQRTPHSIPLLRELTEVAHNRGDWSVVELCCVQLRSLAKSASPDAIWATRKLGFTAFARGQYAQAARLLERAWQGAPSDVETVAYLARAAFRAGRLGCAQQATEAWRAHHDSCDARRLAARVAVELGEPTRAIELLDADDWPEQAHAHFAAGNLGHATAAAQRALEFAQTPADKHAARCMLVEVLLAGERTTEAMDTACAGDADEPKLKMLLARAQLLAGDSQAACTTTAQSSHAGLLALRTLALAASGQTNALEHLRDLDRFVLTRSLAVDCHATAAALRAHVEWHQAPWSHATQHGRHSASLLRDVDPAIDHTLDAITQAVVGYARELRGYEHPWVRARPNVTGLHAWAVELSGPARQLAHVHPDGWLSGVLYLETPPRTPKPQGWLAFASPPTPLARCAQLAARHIQPHPGMLVLFPSFLWHETIPTNSQHSRLSLAFDIVPAVKRPSASSTMR